MIKGILALFRSGLIFNPMVLLGILTGFTAMGTLEDEQLHQFYTNYHLYLLMFLVAGIYVYIFKRTYYKGGVITDWQATIQTMVGHFLMLVVSFIFSMLFVMVMSFSGDEDENYDLPEFDQVTADLQNNQQELQQNYNAIMEAVDGPTAAQIPAQAEPLTQPAPQASTPAQ